jgi:TM2 domain-containing membrane protein YozV
MNRTFLDQLIGFIATPYGAIGIAIGALIVFQASRSRATGWFLFSLCCFAASLNKYQDQWIKVPPPLLFPLQQMRNVGRPLAIVLLVAMVILALATQTSWRQKVLPKPIDYLILVQGAIIFKTLLYGSIEFALLSAATFGGIIFMLKRGPGQWLQNDENFHMAARAIAVVGLIFVVVNTYQYAINPDAVTFVHNRFLGTTGNPQHAAVLLAATIPCLMFLIQTSSRWNFAKFMWVVVLIAVMYYLFITGSRTGILMGAISILLFYRNNGGAWLRIVIGLAIFAAVIIPFLEPQALSSSSAVDPTVSSRFSSIDNTRADVWNGMWKGFQENPVFGAPLQGDRMGYGENSWLAAGAGLGLIGFIPMMVMGWESLNLMWKLNQLSQRQSYYFFHCSAVIAGLGSLLLGSIFEAFLLGTITFSLIAFLTYLIMAAYLLEIDRARTHYMRTNADSIDRAGVYQ